MNETVIWKGRSSQLVNFGTYFIGLLVLSFSINPAQLVSFGNFFALLAVGKMAWAYLQTSQNTYTVTNQRIKREEGIIYRNTYDIELWRVFDVELTEPIWLRAFSLGHIRLISAQVMKNEFYFAAVPYPKQLRETIRSLANRQGGTDAQLLLAHQASIGLLD